MVFELNYSKRRILTKAAWIRGKRNNQAAIPTDIAQIKETLFVKNSENFEMSYEVEYEDGRVGYIFFSELEHCEMFSLENKIDKSTLT